jgi:hypothetical protein
MSFIIVQIVTNNYGNITTIMLGKLKQKNALSWSAFFYSI